MKTNLLNLLIGYLEKRGRIVRAGGDNLPKHLSVVLDIGPVHDALRELLLSQPVELDVQLDGCRITSVSLAAWAATEEGREVDEVPEDNDAMWAFAMSLVTDENRRLVAKIAALESDLEVAIELLADSSHSSQECAMLHVDETELATLRGEAADLRKQLETLRTTYAGLQQRYAVLAKEHRDQVSHVCDTSTPEYLEDTVVAQLIRAIDEGRLSIIQLDGPHRTL